MIFWWMMSKYSIKSNYQHEPTQKEVKQDYRVKSQFSFIDRNHLSHESYRSYLVKMLHREAQTKLNPTIASLKTPGIQSWTKTIRREAAFIGKRQYPSKLAAWKKLISEPKKLAFKNTTKDPTHMMTKIDVMIVLL